jgi:hypothetical protein
MIHVMLRRSTEEESGYMAVLSEQSLVAGSGALPAADHSSNTRGIRKADARKMVRRVNASWTTCADEAQRAIAEKLKNQKSKNLHFRA